MVENKLDLTCHACGQHFETKADLKDHEKVCTAQRGSGTSQSGSKQQGSMNRGQTSSSEQESGQKTRGAGSGASWRGESDV